MEQIADAAALAKSTLYNHFSVKEAALAQWMHVELAAHPATLHDQLEMRPSFAEGALHVLNHSAPAEMLPETTKRRS